MSRENLNKMLAALKSRQRLSELEAKRNLALKQFDTAQYEFEFLLQNTAATTEQIEAGRLRVITLYEGYIDAGLAFRAASHEVDGHIEDLLKGLD